MSIEIHIDEFTATKKKAPSGTFVDIYLFIYPFQMSSYCKVNICKDEIIRVVVFQVEKRSLVKKCWCHHGLGLLPGRMYIVYTPIRNNGP